MPLPHTPQDLEDLQGQFAGRRDDERPEPVPDGPPLPVEPLEEGDDEGLVVLRVCVCFGGGGGGWLVGGGL